MRSHPLNVGYLVVGLVFWGIAGSWALRQTNAIDEQMTRWVLPLLLVGAGLVGLLAYAAKGLDHRRGDGRGDREGYPAQNPGTDTNSEEVNR